MCPATCMSSLASRVLVLYQHFFRQMRSCYTNSWLCEYRGIRIRSSRLSHYRLNREYETVCPLFNDPYRPNLFNYQIYKSRWSLSKCLYLVCRFGLLLCWPIVMYALSFDHDKESCQPFLVIVSVLFILFVRPALFFLLTNSQLTLPIYIPLTSQAPLNVYLSSVHMLSQVQSDGHCSFIYPASLPTSSSSPGILWTKWHSGKMPF